MTKFVATFALSLTLCACLTALGPVLVVDAAAGANAGDATSYDPSSATEDHTLRAKQFSAAGDGVRATLAFRAAVRFDPDSVTKRQNLAVSLMRLGELEASRRAFGDAIALARRLKKPLRSLHKDLDLLKGWWENDFMEHMDPIEGEGGIANDKVDLDLFYQQRLDNVPPFMLAERKHLDEDTAGRGIDGGLERRLSQEELDAAPPKEFELGGTARKAGTTQDELLQWVGSPAFQNTYWEQWPLRIRALGAVQSLTSFSRLCNDGPYGYSKFPHRNVNYLRVTFGNKDPIKVGTPQDCPELKDALSRGYTLQFLGTHRWVPSIANMSYWLSKETARLVKVNLYVTPQGQETSLVPHSDFQCSLMMQLEGRKRWRLWKRPDAWLPVRLRHIHGRADGDTVDPAWLGEPYMDVVLEPGDVLYVPRGCMHLTSTVLGEEVREEDGDGGSDRNTPSVHLTVGMEALAEQGVGMTWEAFLGAGEFTRHDHVLESYYRALGNLIDKDMRFRESLPKWFLDAEVTTVGQAGSHVREWDEELRVDRGKTAEIDHADKEAQAEHNMKEQARARLYAIVDEMIDGTPLFERVRRLTTQTKAVHNQQLRKLVDRAERNHRGSASQKTARPQGEGQRQKRRQKTTTTTTMNKNSNNNEQKKKKRKRTPMREEF